MNVTSQEQLGKGTLGYLPSERKGPLSDGTERVGRQPPKVLVVDDRADNRLAFRAQLMGQEIELLEARSGEEALDLLLSHEVALALVDVQMPGMDGFQLAELMRGMDRTRHIPIIFVTAGLHDQSKIFRGYDAGAIDFLVKPIESHILNGKVSVLLQLHQQKQLLAQQVEELKRVRESLTQERDSKAMMAALAEESPNTLVIYDSNLRFRYINRAGLTRRGVPEDQILGKRDEEVFPAHMTETYLPRLRAALETRKTQRFEATYTLPTGHTATILICYVPLLDRRGRVKTILGITTDITDRKRIEEELRQAAEQLKEANESLQDVDRRKNDFLAVLSHEMRNPLAPIRNALHILERAAPGSDIANRSMEVLHRQVEQLVRLIDDLLDVTRIARNKLQLERTLVDLNQHLRRVADDQRFLFERGGVTFDIEMAQTPLWVLADPGRLTQVIGNLLNNAAKFTPAGKTVTLSSWTDSAGKRAAFRVADSGAGISKQALLTLFRPFAQATETLEQNRTGLGLGLALVKGLVEAHGGSVTAESDGIDRGSQFTVMLPLHDGP
jgi:PAS domain S-box-containing protein